MTQKIDKIIRSKRKTIALTITSDARLVIRSPNETTLEFLNWLVEKKRRWIYEKMNLILKKKTTHPKKTFRTGEGFLYLGDYFKLEFSDRANSISVSSKHMLFPEKFLADPEKAVTEWYKKEAKKVLAQRANWYCNLYGFSYKKIKITDARRRWGSCGYQNTLNFSWRLVMAPVCVIDYVVLHELCHTYEKSHSEAFWVKMKMAMPNYEKQKRWLEENQQMLEL